MLIQTRGKDYFPSKNGDERPENDGWASTDYSDIHSDHETANAHDFSEKLQNMPFPTASAPRSPKIGKTYQYLLKADIKSIICIQSSPPLSKQNESLTKSENVWTEKCWDH